jgi:hypothetical protein
MKSGRIGAMNKYLIIKVISALIFAVASTIGYTLDITEITNLDFKWWPLIGLAVFFGLVVWIFIDLYGKNNRLINNKPKLVYQEKRETALYIGENQIFHGLQVWFVNKPVTSTVESVAEDVTAKITFYDISEKTKFSVYGLWVLGVAYDFAGYKGAKNKVDRIPPNDEPHKLAVAIKWLEDDSAYAFVEESRLYSRTLDYREKGREIKKGTHYVEIQINGTRIGQPPIWFKLENPGKDGNLVLSDPVQKPNLHKEGFQL